MESENPQGPTILNGYRPGIFGALLAMNADYYIRQRGFDPELEAFMAGEFAHFWKRYDADFDAIFYIEDHGPVVGGALLQGVERDRSQPKQMQSVKLQWFIIGNALRGEGFGRKLLNEILAHARAQGFGKLSLTTDPLAYAAIHLYENAGFVKTGELPDTNFGQDTVRLFYEYML